MTDAFVTYPTNLLIEANCATRLTRDEVVKNGSPRPEKINDPSYNGLRVPMDNCTSTDRLAGFAPRGCEAVTALLLYACYDP